MKILGVDYGEAKIGLALGDTESHLALPYDILQNNGWEDTLSSLESVCQKESVSLIVVGLPINQKTESASQMEKINLFVKALKMKTGIETAMQDERFTTQEAKKLKKTKGRDDALSAMLILQSYMDRQN